MGCMCIGFPEAGASWEGEVACLHAQYPKRHITRIRRDVLIVISQSRKNSAVMLVVGHPCVQQ